MPSPLPFPPGKLALLGLVLVLAGCQPGSNPRPVPSVPQIGGDLKCSGGDHGYEDLQAGWGFCYPGTWKYTQRSQASESPSGLDLTFDVTDVPCSSPGPGGAAPRCSPNAGLFAFMIISTYQRGTSGDLTTWVQANLKPTPDLQTISWGNAVEAVRLNDGRRIALTPHHVVIMDLHSGLLDLETEMGSRLGTWKFSF
jgi:hypothetical protein